MTEIAFQKYAVAFLDILGFKDFIARAEVAGSKEYVALLQLKEAIDRQLNFESDDGADQSLFPTSVELNCIYISDSLILTAPITDKSNTHYSGLVAVSIKAIQLTHALLRIGFLIRGGIAVGNAYRTESNILGTGYQAAYATESTLADAPRILLHKTATDALADEWHSGIKAEILSIFMRDGSDIILDTLNTHWSYLGNDKYVDKIDRYLKYRGLIESTITKLPHGRPRQKWVWMADFFNSKLLDDSGLRPLSRIEASAFSSFSYGHPSTTNTLSFREAFADFIPDRRYVERFKTESLDEEQS